MDPSIAHSLGILGIALGICAPILLLFVILGVYLPPPKGFVIMSGAIAGISGLAIICAGLSLILIPLLPMGSPFMHWLSLTLTAIGAGFGLLQLAGAVLILIGAFVIFLGNRSPPQA